MDDLKLQEQASSLREIFAQIPKFRRLDFIRKTAFRKRKDGSFKSVERYFLSPKNLLMGVVAVLLLLALVVIGIILFRIFQFALFKNTGVILSAALFFALCCVAFFVFLTIIGLIFNSSYRRQFLGSIKFSEAEIVIPEHPLKLGGVYDFSFKREINLTGKINHQGKVIVRVACLESTSKKVETSQDTTTETEVNIVWSSHGTVYEIPSGSKILSVDSNIRIPKDISPSFKGKNNQIIWILSIEQNVPKTVNKVYSNFEFLVDPIVIS